MEAIKRMSNDPVMKAHVDQHGLVINEISWDDCARTKGSVWGPCISDATLRVREHNMPVIRPPNFTDVTWDSPMDTIQLVVGNEAVDGSGGTVEITLAEYLKNLEKYISYPERWKGGSASLLNGDDEEHAVMSAQSCFLPMDEDVCREPVSFNPCVYTYGSNTSGDQPKVLYIVATCHGTSAQFMESSDKDTTARGSLLYVNKNGERASLCGVRIEDDRRERGVPETGPMTKDEAAQNLIMIIQVPLKASHLTEQCAFGSSSNAASFSFSSSKGVGASASASKFDFSAPSPGSTATTSDFGSSYEPTSSSGFTFGAPLPSSTTTTTYDFGSKEPSYEPTSPSYSTCEDYDNEETLECARMPSTKKSMSHAIVRVGDSEGHYEELGNKRLRRDTKYPVRVTMQYYKMTNGAITNEHVKEVADQINAAIGKGVAFGSLVLQTDSGRKTEHMKAVVDVPPWWDIHWATYHETYTCSKKKAAKHFFNDDERYRNTNGEWMRASVCLPIMKKYGALIRKKCSRTSSPTFSSNFGLE